MLKQWTQLIRILNPILKNPIPADTVDPHQMTLIDDMGLSLRRYQEAQTKYLLYIKEAGDAGHYSAQFLIGEMEFWHKRYANQRMYYEHCFGDADAYQQRLYHYAQWRKENPSLCQSSLQSTQLSLRSSSEVKTLSRRIKLVKPISKASAISS